jgi:FkbM family methyltransferase
MALIRELTIRAAALYLRNVPGGRGRWRILRSVLPLLRDEGAKMGRRIVRCRHGFLMSADLEDWLGQYIYLTGAYEPPTADLIQKLVGPGDTVLDIGANAGFFSLLAAVRVGAQGRVFAFEPLPSVRQELEANVSLNGFHNVTVRSDAVSNRRATLRLYEVPQAHKGRTSLRQLDDAARSIEVAAIAIDDLQDEFGTVRLAKIDVEGAELLVLDGATRVIGRDHPHLVVEVTDEYLRAFGHSAAALLNWLLDHGYAIYRIAETGLIPVPRGYAAAEGQFNALCVFEDRLPEAVVRSVRR